MSLRLNFCHEIQEQRSARQRDPLKISAYILGTVVAGFAALYAVEFGKYASVSGEFSRKKAEFEVLGPKAAAAQIEEEEFQNTVKLNTRLVKQIEERFHWAPLLEQIGKLVPPDVQLTKLAGEIQGEGLRKCQLTVGGLSAGADPRRVAEDLRQSITENFAQTFRKVDAKFATLEDGTEMAMLSGQQWPTATFAINVQFESGDEPPPVVRPATSRKKARAAAAE